MHPHTHVFLPHLTLRTTLSLLTPTTTRLYPFISILKHQPNRQPHRHINRYAKAVSKGTPATRISTDPTLDERIGNLRSPAHLVDDTGNLQPAQPLGTLLAQVDRSINHLRRVGQADDGKPVCKVVSREWLLAQLRAADSVAGSAVKRDADGSTKQVELTWAITANDLGYRLKRMQGFLREGRRVEMYIAPKKRGRRADAEEIKAVLARIREAAEEVEGTREWKVMVGEPGRIVEMYFVGQGEPEEEAKEKELNKKQEKLRRKEAEEQERREKEEKRQRRRAEELEQRAKMAASL